MFKVYLRNTIKLYLIDAKENKFYDLYTSSCYVDEYSDGTDSYVSPGIMNAYTLVAVIPLI